MHLIRLCVLLSLLSVLTACSTPTEECLLTAQQQAWQPYQTGQVLRFGRVGSPKVRTFEVAVAEQTVTIRVGGSAPVYLGPGQKYNVHEVDVTMRRTDTVRYVLTAISSPAHPDSIPFTRFSSLLDLEANGCLPGSSNDAPLVWDVGFVNTLPLQQLKSGLGLPDTTQHLLPTLQLGGVPYDSVFRLSNQARGPNYVPRNKPARLVYYAKSYGVVGFLEGNTLWYRLP